MSPRPPSLAIFLSATAIACAAVAVSLLILRSVDPALPLPSQLTLQNWIVLALAGLGAVRFTASRQHTQDAAPPPERSRLWMAAIAAAAILPFLWCVRVPFVSDDYYLVALANHAVPTYPGNLLIHAGSREFFRPLGGVTLAITAAYGHFDPRAWHLTSMALHATNCVLVYLLALRLSYRQSAAVLAGILFAWNGTRPEAVMLAASRFDLLSTLLLLLGLLWTLRYLRTLSAAALAVSVVLGSLAMLTKESAFVFPILVVLLGLEAGRAVTQSIRMAIPASLAGAVLFAIRYLAVGGIGGYDNPQTGRPEILGVRFLPAAKALFLRVWEVLTFPINWSRPAGPLLLLLLALMVAVLVWVLLRTTRQFAPQQFFAIALVLVSGIPAITQLLIGTTLEKSRLLYFPALGFCLLAASLFQRLPAKTFWIAAAAVAAFHMAALEHNLAIWHDVATLTDRTCADVAAAAQPPTTLVEVADLPGSIDGVYFLRNGLTWCSQRAGAPTSVEIRETTGSAAASPGAVTLRWDPVLQTLKRGAPPEVRYHK